MFATKLTQFPSSVIKPALVNQDYVENHFCQVQSCNGQNNNLTYLNQQSTQNSITFRQTTISQKSNTGNPSVSSFSSCSLPSNAVCSGKGIALVYHSFPQDLLKTMYIFLHTRPVGQFHII